MSTEEAEIRQRAIQTLEELSLAQIRTKLLVFQFKQKMFTSGLIAILSYSLLCWSLVRVERLNSFKFYGLELLLPLAGFVWSLNEVGRRYLFIKELDRQIKDSESVYNDLLESVYNRKA